MGTIDFQQPIVSTTKTNMKLFLIAAVLVASVFAEPESEAKADAKPWLAYSNLGYAGWPYAADMLPTQPPMDLDTTDTLLDTLELTSSEREKLTPKPSHGRLMLTTDMLDTHTLPPMVPTLTHPSTTLPTLAQSPPMLELTSSAREKLKPTPGTDIPDTLPHTPPMVDMLLTVHTPTDVYMVLTDTDGKLP